MKNVKLLLFVILFSKSINAQTNLGNTFSGSGNPATILCPQTRAAFTDEKVNQLIVEILNVSNLKNRFIIMPCSGISNCQAIYYEGKPYILYNAAFLNEIKGLSFSEKDLVVSERNWESLTILAHELGHHFNNHLNNPPPGATAQQLELEADEFAGSTIYMLGGSLIQSQSAFKSESVSESYTHPGRMARLAAVAKGWNDASLRFVNKGGKRTEPAIVTKNYNSVKIGSQQWMTENLDVSTYTNGDIIPQVTHETVWANLTTGAWCYYDNDPKNGAIYGKLYNSYAVNDPRGLAPQGWHIPTDAEWITLGTSLGGDAAAGGKMKTTGTRLWRRPNSRATNESGFAGLPGGYRNQDGVFSNLCRIGFWWSYTETSTYSAWFRGLNFDGGVVNSNDMHKRAGFSVRCLSN